MRATDAGETHRHRLLVPLPDIVTRLERFYGLLPFPPGHPFRCYVWEALSTQTTPARRDAAYAALHRIPALTPDSMFRAARGKLTAATALAGPYQEQRLHALLAGVERFRRHPRFAEAVRGPLREARRTLARLPRLGDASAHRLLLFSGDHCVMPVDRETARLSARLGLSPEVLRPGGARRTRRALEQALPRDVATFKHAALYLRHHAQQTCTDDPHCSVCPLNDICPGRQEQRPPD